jgi:copper oxidase (laccase) domain-containing protein
VAVVHASWRSTVSGITEHLITAITKELKCQAHEMIACICPSAGPECYEVGPEVRDAAIKGMGSHADTFFKPYGAKLHFDLWRANTDALLRSGLCSEHIHVAGLCTLCNNNLFPSHRKEGEAAGRFVAAIGLAW